MSHTDLIINSVEAAATADGFALDTAQRDALGRLALLGAGVADSAHEGDAPRSLYLHGQAGRGKSWLAGACVNAAPTQLTKRVHYHGFFDELHHRIQHHRGQRDAAERAVDELVGNSRLLFFDELHVHDSGDALLMTRLLEYVFSRHITVIATSNYAPHELLPDPFWHHVFEPGRALIQTHMDVLSLNGPADYRMITRDHSSGFAAGVWSTGTPPVGSAVARLIVSNGRTFSLAAAADGTLWASFDQLCRTPTAPADYLRWAGDFSRWVITDVPRFEVADSESQQRWINLVDVLVDANIRVDFFSEATIDEFLQTTFQRPDAFRMASRLRLLQTRTAASVLHSTQPASHLVTPAL